MDSLPEVAGAGPHAVLAGFRLDFHACLTARADELCELADAVLCTGCEAGDPQILVIFDAGYDVARLAFLLADLPVEVLGRLRSDRVLCFPPQRRPGRGRPPRHGREFKLADEAGWPAPAVTTITQTTRYGTAAAHAWDQLHPRLTHRSAWLDHDGDLPVIDGTLIRL
jgi:hypothetical protein